MTEQPPAPHPESAVRLPSQRGAMLAMGGTDDIGVYPPKF